MHRVSFSFVFVALVSLACAYNYDDLDYNQILARDWEELHEDVISVHPRARRDEEAVTAAAVTDKCRKRKLKFCCADEVLENIHEEDKVYKRECFKQITGKEKPFGNYHGSDPFTCDKDKIDKHRKQFNCVMQCVGQKKDVIDADGNLKESNLKAMIKTKFEKEEWLLPQLDEMVEKCLNEAKQPSDEDKDKVKEEDECSKVGIRFGHCFWKSLQMSCPQDQIKDQKACDHVKDRIKNHPEFSFMSHRHSMDDK